jgi:hypothetical protein
MSSAEREANQPFIVATYPLGNGWVVPKRLLVMGEPSVSQSAEPEASADTAACPVELDESPADSATAE